MNGIFAYALQILAGVLDQSRAFFDALSLHAPSILAQGNESRLTKLRRRGPVGHLWL